MGEMSTFVLHAKADLSPNLRTYINLLRTYPPKTPDEDDKYARNVVEQIRKDYEERSWGSTAIRFNLNMLQDKHIARDVRPLCRRIQFGDERMDASAYKLRTRYKKELARYAIRRDKLDIQKRASEERKVGTFTLSSLNLFV